MTEAPSAEDDRTLHVYVDGAEELRAQTKARIRAAEAHEEYPSIGHSHVLTVESEMDLARLVSPANLELLRAIRRQAPNSMREAASIVDRDFKEVHRNLTELHELGVIEFVADGRARPPRVRYDELDVHYPLGDERRGTVEEPA